MKLIAGLGNPGREYRWTRHNAVSSSSIAWRKSTASSSAERVEIRLWAGRRSRGEEVILAKPQTFMNLSGEAV